MAKAATAKDTATVTKRGKQAELLGVEPSQRKIAEIEELGDTLIDYEDQLSALKGKRDDAMDDLVASMKRHKRTYYNRQTWGTVTLTEAKTKARVKKSTGGEDDEGEED